MIPADLEATQEIARTVFEGPDLEATQEIDTTASMSGTWKMIRQPTPCGEIKTYERV